MNWPIFFFNEEHFNFHLQYKHSGMFANCKYEELSYPKNQKIGDPILVTLLKMQPHYSKSNCENVTPSSGTSPLASYEEVPRRARNPRSIPLEAVMMPFSREGSHGRTSLFGSDGYVPPN